MPTNQLHKAARLRGGPGLAEQINRVVATAIARGRLGVDLGGAIEFVPERVDVAIGGLACRQRDLGR